MGAREQLGLGHAARVEQPLRHQGQRRPALRGLRHPRGRRRPPGGHHGQVPRLRVDRRRLRAARAAAGDVALLRGGAPRAARCRCLRRTSHWRLRDRPPLRHQAALDHAGARPLPMGQGRHGGGERRGSAAGTRRAADPGARRERAASRRPADRAHGCPLPRRGGRDLRLRHGGCRSGFPSRDRAAGRRHRGAEDVESARQCRGQGGALATIRTGCATAPGVHPADCWAASPPCRAGLLGPRRRGADPKGRPT